MGMYVGEPPYEVSCDGPGIVGADRCYAAGPAAWDEEQAGELAEQAGWLIDDPERGCGDYCPRCKNNPNRKAPPDLEEDPQLPLAFDPEHGS